MTKQEKNKPLEERVFKIEPLLDNREEFIPYCNYERHRGVIIDNTKCEKYDCPHYMKLFLEYQE
jgi:hypothetical protein